jgi:hypothetical protein
MLTTRALCLVLTLTIATQSFAQSNGTPPPVAAVVQRTIAILPIAVGGTDDTSADAKLFNTALERQLSTIAGTTVITSAQVADALKKAKKPLLRNCDGDLACLVEVGKLVGASVVIAGELGGLGASKVVYLSAIDVGTGKELNATNVAFGSGDSALLAQGALIRLLDPDRYLGNLEITVDVKGASAYVDGKRVGVSPLQPVSITVGTHALRVTHPEYRDFVRFVDVAFGTRSEIKVGLAQYPIVQQSIVQNAKGPTQPIVYHQQAWYRRWYVVAGGAVLLGGITTALVIGGNRISPDETRKVP